MLATCTLLAAASLSSLPRTADTCLGQALQHCGFDLHDRHWGCGPSASSPLCIRQLDCLAARADECFSATPLHRAPIAAPLRLDCHRDSLRRCGVDVEADLSAPHTPPPFCMNNTQGCLDQWRCMLSGANGCLGTTVFPVSHLPATVNPAWSDRVHTAEACVRQAVPGCASLRPASRPRCEVEKAYRCLQGAGVVSAATSGTFALPPAPPASGAAAETAAECTARRVEECAGGRGGVACGRNSTQGCLEQVRCSLDAFDACQGTGGAQRRRLEAGVDCAQSLGDTCGYGGEGATDSQTAARVLCGFQTMVTCATNSDALTRVMDTAESCVRTDVIKGCGLDGNQDAYDEALLECAATNALSCAQAAMASLHGHSTPVPAGSDADLSWWVYLCIGVGGVAVLALMVVAACCLCRAPPAEGKQEVNNNGNEPAASEV